MGEDGPQSEVSTEISRLLTDYESSRGQASAEDPQYLDARRQVPASAAFSNGDTDNPAVAVLGHIYRDMIAALQQMYRDTIAAKDDALAGRDRELETKDALIAHLKKRAEDAEARASQALRYIGELDGDTARPSAPPVSHETTGRRRGLARLFGKK